MPFFVMEGRKKSLPIASMPGVKRHSVDRLLDAVGRFHKSGGQAGLLFGIPPKKDFKGSAAYDQKGIVQKAVKAIKNNFPEFVIVTDVCLCGYLKHGHCGVVVDGYVDNDKSVEILARVALSHARAGADFVAPSDMMDFRVRRIREELDRGGFTQTGILSYAVKYASAFYGPFREAAGSAPGFGDRKSYQMDPANSREALKEALQDIQEGADIVMVKPALAYLDVIQLLRQNLAVPIAAYNVSGEYAMIKAASARGWIKEKDVVLESLTAVKRAGADIIITYFAEDVLKWI